MIKLKTFLERLELAVNSKTIYATGGIGFICNAENKERLLRNTSNMKYRKSIIENATDDTYAFDCIGLIKAILWGWNKQPVYMGGAKYDAKTDLSEKGLLDVCKNVTPIHNNFDNIPVGAYLYMKGHGGIYIGNYRVIECYSSGGHVAITDINRVKWLYYGLLPYIEYNENVSRETPPEETAEEVTHIVKRGDTLWGISKKYFGDGAKWRTIATYNGIATTNIYPNQIIKIPKGV